MWASRATRPTPGERPRFLLRDNDAKYGSHFARLAEASGITVVRTPVRAPRANAIVERFQRSVGRECLDHLLPLGEYVACFNRARPHQGRGQRVPLPSGSPAPGRHSAGDIVAIPVLSGLHHTYRRATCRPPRHGHGLRAGRDVRQ